MISGIVDDKEPPKYKWGFLMVIGAEEQICGSNSIVWTGIRLNFISVGDPTNSDVRRRQMAQGVRFSYIGMIRTPNTRIEGMPIQPLGAEGLVGYINIYPEFIRGLKDIEGFSHIFLIYHLHLGVGSSLEVVPFLDKVTHGIFATRSPRRPNAIGLSVVRLLSVEGPKLSFANPDMLDETPLLDIKPYVAAFDRVEPEREGWFKGRANLGATVRADDRFLKG